MTAKANWYTKDLIEQGESRQRLTKQLATLVNDVAAIIAQHADTRPIETPDGTYSVWTYNTHLGDSKLLTVLVDKEIRVFAKKEPGSKFRLDGMVPLKVASRDDYITFAANLHQIISGFESNEQEVINALQDGFAKLREIAQ